MIAVIDPGPTTCLLTFKRDTLDIQYELLEINNSNWLKQLSYIYRECCWSDHLDTIIVENYRPLRADGDEVWAAKIVGAFMGWQAVDEAYGGLGYETLSFPRRALILQEPLVQQAWSDEMLATLEIDPANRHKRSALKHLLYYLHEQNDAWVAGLYHTLAEAVTP